MRKFVMAGILFISIYSCSPSKADEIGDLKTQLQLQADLIEQMQVKIGMLEEKQQANATQIKANSEHSIISLANAENLKLYGDFRYRHEIIDAENSDSSNKKGRNRQRIRARLGMNYKINDNMDFDLRFASGSDDPVSTNQTLDGYFTSKDFWLDRAYLTWHASDSLKILAGKMCNPFYSAMNNQLIWDGDLNPEGIAAQYNLKIDDRTAAFINTAGFWVEEESSDVDQSLWGIQGYLKKEFDNFYALGGLSYYEYGNMQGSEAFFESDGKKLGFGNTLADGKYVNDYDLLEVFGECGTKLGAMPVAVYASYVNNIAAKTSGDKAWLAGCKINKAKKPGSWEMSYDYRDVEKDSVFGVFSDSDFAGGGTDAKGHRIGFDYQVAKNVKAGITHFYNQRTDEDIDYNRTMLDLSIKF